MQGRFLKLEENKNQQMNTSQYIFKSKRLGFRNWKNEDFKEFSLLNSDVDVMEHFPKTLSKKEVKSLMEKLQNHFSKKGFTYYATEILETQEFIGMIGLAHQDYKSDFTPAIDMGWRLKKKAWGKGYATEGAQRCLEYAFNELGLTRIISVCNLKNIKSENVMKKIGMKKIGVFDHPDGIIRPELKKHYCYEIVKKEGETGG